MAAPAYALGLENSPRERAPQPLRASAPLPPWLRGVLLRTGPALFELGPDRLAHWFDGLAKLQRLEFAAGGITYSSALLRSRALAGYRRSGCLASQEFASRPRRSAVGRVLELLRGAPLTDNGNVNVLPLPDGSWLALTETTRALQVDDDLQHTRAFRFHDRWPGQLTTAHPVLDRRSGEVINLVLQLGLRSSYMFTSWDPLQRRRRLLARLPVRRPAYQHSFAVTPRHLVLIESPLRVNP
ncbi:MAG: carotenoid oxygenase family protein, partial [Cyanobacteriota bacterium]|nr:carotenoid oxygenase family protein [Cyanobacteriota bacterium]